jgi:hypothetical protein
MSDNPVEKAVERAVAAEAKAIASGDANDFVAAETAYHDASRTAYAATSAMPSTEKLGAEWYRLSDLAKGLSRSADVAKQKADEVRDAVYRKRRDLWSRRDVMIGGRPPATMNVLDERGGFTAITKKRRGESAIRGETLWRPGAVLKGETTGSLQESDPRSFYQTNNDVTQAIYKVRGYRYPVAVWFDNRTGTRVA